MIAVKPGTDAWSLLALVVAQPGQLDAEALGQALWKPKVTGSNYLEVRRAIQQHGKEWSKKASTLLHRLQQQGLIERCRPPLPGPAYGVQGGEGLGELASGLLGSLVRNPPQTMQAWVGSAPSGNVQRAIAELVEAALVVLPSQRWPTQAGIERVASWKKEAA